MEKLYELKTLNAIERNIVSFPIKPIFNSSENKITFSFVSYEQLKEMLKTACDKFTTENLTERNVAIYEQDAARIRKIADLIKKSATSYVEDFTLELLGRTRGKNKVKGQVGELVEILMTKYNEVHAQTKAIRETLRNAENLNETEETVNNTTKVVLTLETAYMSDLKAFCEKRNIKMEEIK